VRFVGLLPNAKRTGDGMPLRGDPLSQEQWDIELDGAYQMNARTSTQRVSFEPGEIIFRMADGTSEQLDVPDPDMNDFSANQHAMDAGSVRLGGTYNVLPSVLGVSAGTFYETRAVEASYANIDTFAFSRFGVGLGVMMRLSNWDFAVAYGHVFQEKLVVAPPKHATISKTTADPTSGFDKRVGAPQDDTDGFVLEEQNAPKKAEIDATARREQSSLYDFAGKHTRVVNAGVYKASFDVISVGAAYRFRPDVRGDAR
jgi:hypothetical protein